MNEPFYIQSYGALTANGIYAYGQPVMPYDPDQHSPLDIKRAQVYDLPHMTFGKLQPSDRLAFSAAALAFKNYSDFASETTGISMGSTFGSLSTDMRYMESVAEGFPRPAYFSATLPSSPVAEVAIMFKLKGLNRVFCGGASCGLQALESAQRSLTLKKATTMLCIVVTALDTKDTSLPWVNTSQPITSAAYAFICSSTLSSQGLNARISLKNEPSANNSMTSIAEESYFLSIIQALTKNESFSLAIKTADYTGTFSLTKD
jgi:hypothetical protein